LITQVLQTAVKTEYGERKILYQPLSSGMSNLRLSGKRAMGRECINLAGVGRNTESDGIISFLPVDLRMGVSSNLLFPGNVVIGRERTKPGLNPPTLPAAKTLRYRPFTKRAIL
jgi:hypothetical protein